MSDPWVQNTQQWINLTYPGMLGILPLVVDGQTGWNTIYALIRALQHELGITALSNNFGPGTLAALTAVSPVNDSTVNKNIIRIAQGAMYCKGYNGGNGALDGVWDAVPVAGMQSLRTNMGLSAGDGSIEPKVFKALLNMDAFTLVSGGTSAIRSIQQSLNGRYLHRQDFYVIPTDGYYTRDVQRALMFAIQYEVGIADGVANGNFGPATKSGLQTYGALTLGSTDTTRYLVHLFQAALIFNGYSVAYDGNYGSGTRTQTLAFQEFVALPQNGNADVQTWGSLLVSTGDADRPGAGADCVTTLTSARLTTLRGAGYEYFGRYLTNATDDNPDKCFKPGEAARIIAAGGKIFPLFQTGGGSLEHFTYQRGKEVAEEAANAAWWYRMPANAVIYFSVDFDVQDWELTDFVIPYFQGVNEMIDEFGRNWRVGVYGPRHACARISGEGLATYSFVSDMSTGYAGNLTYTRPANWAFDQIQTITVGSGSGAVEIDKNSVSGRDAAVSALAAAVGVGDDPQIPSSQLDAFESEWYGACTRYPDELLGSTTPQLAVMALNRSNVKTKVESHDAFITNLASEYNIYKALIMTPLIWESMVINIGDDVQDSRVIAYYAAVLAGQAPPALSVDDSSTGPCQIFARTGIDARNWARSRGFITDGPYSASVPQDMFDVWEGLHNDEEFNIETAMFEMMRQAEVRSSMAPSSLRDLTPSQVLQMCWGYNGDVYYGRHRAQLYYTIMRWEDSFR